MSGIREETQVLTFFSRAPGSLVHPKKLKVDKNNNEINEYDARKPKSTRHIILIRHGQYEVDGTTDEQRVLTKLGRMQAEYTGKRLKDLGFPYTTIVRSTMARAQETANIISQSLPQVNFSKKHKFMFITFLFALISCRFQRKIVI